MKRYAPSEHENGHMVEDGYGAYVYHSDAQAEIERLVNLLESAYMAGFDAGMNGRKNLNELLAKYEHHLSTETRDESK